MMGGSSTSSPYAPRNSGRTSRYAVKPGFAPAAKPPAFRPTPVPKVTRKGAENEREK